MSYPTNLMSENTRKIRRAHEREASNRALLVPFERYIKALEAKIAGLKELLEARDLEVKSLRDENQRLRERL